MTLQGVKKTEDYIWLRYKTTYTMSWSRILDLMQVFLEDIGPNYSCAATVSIAGADPKYINTIKNGYLYKTDEFIKEQGAIILAGKSKIFDDAEIEITSYNQSKVVDVKIPTTETEIVKEIEADNHLLDVYMNSLEINGRIRDAQRYAINLFGDYLMTPKDDENIEAIARRFQNVCYDLGATPFPEKKQKQPKQIDITCPVCNHEFKYDDSKIPDGERYEVPCPKCGMLMKRKK